MSLFSVIKNILTYREPINRGRFELLEDEQEDMQKGSLLSGQAPQAQQQPQPAQPANAQQGAQQPQPAQPANAQQGAKQPQPAPPSNAQQGAQQPQPAPPANTQQGAQQPQPAPPANTQQGAQQPQPAPPSNAQQGAQQPQPAPPANTQQGAQQPQPAQPANAQQGAQQPQPAPPSNTQQGAQQPQPTPPANTQQGAQQPQPIGGDELWQTPRPQGPKVKMPMDIERWKRIRKSRRGAGGQPGGDTAGQSAAGQQTGGDVNNVKKTLAENLDRIKRDLHYPENQDVVIRQFKVLQQNDAFILYIDGMADNNIINDYILRQLMDGKGGADMQNDTVNYVKNNLLAANQVTMINVYRDIIKQVMNGLTALFIDGCEECFLVETRGFEKRDVSQPLTESVIKGPQEAFIENLRTNVTLVRRIVRNKDLITEILPAGKVNNTTCAILYIKGITNPKVVEEVKKRISSIDMDFVASDGVIDQLIEDHPFAILPQILSTERPDRTASFLMEGKVAIICDGTPSASIVPTTFFNLLYTSEDYTLRWQYGTFVRLIRIIAAALALFLPGLYIALTLYHQEMIPTELLLSIIKTREIVPFPALLEILIMEISFELIREAGIRVPGVIGQTLGIIGAVILGQAAVTAGLVSPILIIIVAITGLGSFTVPNFSMAFAIRILRFVFIILGSVAGFYGIAAGLLVVLGMACSMKSFGVPYLSPVAPKTGFNPDIVVRAPIWRHSVRPDFLNPSHRKRAGAAIRGWEKHGDKGNTQ